jgi:PAS domain S-box-containing protein
MHNIDSSWLAAIVQSSDDAIVGKTLDGVITSWNPAAERLFGYSAAEALGRPVAMLIPTDRPDEEQSILARLSRGERIDHFETVRRRKDGTLVEVSVTISPVQDGEGRIVGASKIARDITGTKRTQAKLQSQVRRLSLLDQITRAIGEHRDLQSIYQVTVGSIEDLMPLDLGCVCEFDPVESQLVVFSVGKRSKALATDPALAEGVRIPVDEDGLSRCIAGSLVYEPDTALLDSAFPRRMAAAGLHSLVISPLTNARGVSGALLAARAPSAAFSSEDCEFIRQLSTHVSLAARQSELLTSLQQASDELRRTQQAAMQQERLRALGQMASGVAHDINNAIFPAVAYGKELLQTEPGLTPPGRQQLESMVRAADDVAAMVGQLRDFYRPRETKTGMAPVRINELVAHALSISRIRWGQEARRRGISIEVKTHLADEIPQIIGSESEIREALVNLIFNAIDAMPNGGTLRINTRRHSPGQTRPWNDGACVDVIDSGTGMSEEARRRCFDPFFTTKGDRGTGMGLATVYGTVQRHGASIDIQSALGQGTTITICFAGRPQHDKRPAAVGSFPSALCGLRVLVVDDDPLVLETLQTMVNAIGHAVTPASGGREAIDAFNTAQAEGDGFQVVMTSLGMPNVDGHAVANLVKQVSPSTPVVMLTGWGESLTAKSDEFRAVDVVISKPPQLRELREVFARFGHVQAPAGVDSKEVC